MTGAPLGNRTRLIGAVFFYCMIMTKRFLKNIYHKLSLTIRFFTAKRVMAQASALTYSTLLAFVPVVAVIFADVPMEDVTIISDDRPSDFTDDIWLLLGLMFVCLLAFCIIIWRAVVASINYKANKIDVDRRSLIDEIDKLKDTNRRLTERNLDLSRKVQDLVQSSYSN